MEGRDCIGDLRSMFNECPDFDLCAECSSTADTYHTKDHGFQIKYPPGVSLPVDGSDLGDLECISLGATPGSGALEQQLKSFNSSAQDKFVRSEVARAGNWRRLHALYRRFESCVGTLADEMRSHGIPVPPDQVSHQAMLRQNWSVGNAKEAAFYLHRDGLIRRDYSQSINKMALGNVLQTFVEESLAIDTKSKDSNDPILCGLPADRDLPTTPDYTKDEDDGSLSGSSLSVNNVKLDQWESLRNEKDNIVGCFLVVVAFVFWSQLMRNLLQLDLGSNMRAFQGQILDIAAYFDKRPQLQDFKTSPLANSQRLASDESLGNIIQQAQLCRRLGHWEKALDQLPRAEPCDPQVIFERFRIFESMGDFRKCAEELEAFRNSPSLGSNGGSPELFLLHLAGAYTDCFIKGGWKKAMDLALMAYEKYLMKASSYSWTLVQIELYYQRIWLAVSRDLGEFTLYDESSKRLGSLRKVLEDAQRFPEAYDTLAVELDLLRWPHRHPIVRPHWTEIDITHWDDIPETVCPRILSFLEKISPLGTAGSSRMVEEAYCRLRLAEAYRRAAAIEKDPHAEGIYLHQSFTERDEAKNIFSACGSNLGLVEILLFNANQGGLYNKKEEAQTEYDRISSLFREQGSLIGVYDTLLSKAKFLHKYFPEPVTKPYSDLAKAAHQTGNLYQWHICRVKMVEWWFISSALVDACESIFQPSNGFLSDTLGIITSWNLSRAYQTIGDFKSAEVTAYYHILLVSRRSDQNHIYSSLLNWFRMRDELIVELPLDKRPATFVNWAQRWIQWLVNIAAQGVERTGMGWRARTADVMSILEMVLWLPKLGSNQVSSLRLQDIGFPPALHVVIPLLELGMGLLEVLPKFFWPILLDQFGLTLGAVLQSCGNSKLAVCTYGKSLVANHPGNLIIANKLRVTMGTLLSQMLKETPSHYCHVSPLATKLLSQAEAFFWNNTTTEDSFKDAVWASVSLGSLLLLRLHIDLPATSPDPTKDQKAKVHAERLLEACSYAIRRAVSGWQGLRQEIFALSLSDTLRRKRLHLSGRLGEMLLLTHLELSIATAQHKEGGIEDVWRTVQEWKAISLSETLGAASTVLREDAGNLDEEARNLLREEHELAERVSMAEPFERPHRRMELRRHWIKMNSHPELQDMLDVRLGHGATLKHLIHIQRQSKQVEEVDESLVFVDWARYHEVIFLFAIRFKEKLTIISEPVSLRYGSVEKWVQQNLGVRRRENGVLFRQRLESVEPLKALSPLIEPLRTFIQRDEMLVLCPTGILNEIPLHAIPFAGTEDPLLMDNPIIYSSSNAILKSCVDSACRKVNEKSITNNIAAFGRYGDLDVVEDINIQTMVTDLAKAFNAKLAVSRSLNRSTFLSFIKDADLVHYHGHSSVELDDKTKRSLILEPNPENNDDGRFTLDDIFKLRLNAAHVTLLACASSDQDVTPNDDPLGILTAFLCAGATSVIGTLWPTESRDARQFCDIFYQQAFKGGTKSTANLARALRETVLLLRDDWDGSSPYHWAQFVLHGAWFCKSMGWKDTCDDTKAIRA
ncbi:hypothetical protein FGG08_005831 [Glutinoglossum americanum]|uniref:CHAT domain-containing protein n=1 Tax=Glutinoglossum americanum TaxID=1670608 RepID=A0A9P8HZK4_9PEZI|nr:hypothetical protein FGG08_005831 [Glutinoglossum americanum]